VLEVSDKGAEIHTHRIPMSQAAAPHRGALEAALCGGDDYELLFTAHPEQRPAIQAIAEHLSLSLTIIGEVTDGPGLDVLDAKGRPFPVEATGWQHF
jgi:thiamine-monophosphate kinase